MSIQRRDVLKAAVAAPFISPSWAYEPPMDYARLGASEAARAIRMGGIKAEDYVDALIKRDSEWATLNAFISRDHDALREAARAVDVARAAGADLGPLHGVPLVFKDNIATSALPTSAGTRALREHRPAANAVVAQKLFDAGALLMGKNNMHELAAGITNNNLTFGPARNPYNQAMIPGGSSGGTGAAIAARVAPAGLGTDTGGSVRIPASLCGTTGLRPTTGRYSGEGLVPFQSGTATAGPMARNVDDLVLLDGLITGQMEQPDIRLDDMRIGVPQAFFYEDIDAEVERVSRDVLERLKDAGATLVYQDVERLADLLAVGRGAPSSTETVRGYERFFASSDVNAEAFVRQISDPAVRARLFRQLLTEESVATAGGPSAIAQRKRYGEVLGDYFRTNNLDAMVIPPSPLPARPIGQDETVELNGQEVSTFQTYVRNTAVGSAAGLPGIVLPAGMTNDGLPVGIELDGPAGSDRRLLAIAGSIEKLIPALPAPE